MAERGGFSELLPFFFDYDYEHETLCTGFSYYYLRESCMLATILTRKNDIV